MEIITNEEVFIIFMSALFNYGTNILSDDVSKNCG